MSESRLISRKVATFTLLAGATLVVLASFRPDSSKVGHGLVSSSIEFKTESWETLLKVAKEENKLIFVDLYATWCGPCKMMKVHTFTKKEVGEFYNGNFINVSLNGEVNKGAELMEKYNLRSFPSLLFINGDDKIVLHTKGYHNPKQILELGNQVNHIQKSELQRP